MEDCDWSKLLASRKTFIPWILSEASFAPSLHLTSLPAHAQMQASVLQSQQQRVVRLDNSRHASPSPIATLVRSSSYAKNESNDPLGYFEYWGGFRTLFDPFHYIFVNPELGRKRCTTPPALYTFIYHIFGTFSLEEILFVDSSSVNNDRLSDLR